MYEEINREQPLPASNESSTAPISQLEKIRQLKDRYSFDLPKDRIRSNSSNNLLWARKGSISALEVRVSLALRKGELNTGQIASAQQFLDYAHNVIPNRNMLLPQDLDQVKILFTSLFGEDQDKGSV